MRILKDTNIRALEELNVEPHLLGKHSEKRAQVVLNGVESQIMMLGARGYSFGKEIFVKASSVRVYSVD
jgi:hypothetical protein